MDITNITPENLTKELKKDIIGQDQYLRNLSTALWMHYLRYDHYIRTGEHIGTPKSNMLVIGKSGNGKTLAIELLAKKILNLPLVIENASLLTGAGWKGNSVDSLALRAAVAAEGNEELEKYAVIVLDEIDKLFLSDKIKDTSFSPVSNLLTFVGGSKITLGDSKDKDAVVVDTNNMLFIFLGAFSGLEEIIQNRISGKSCIGFGAAGYNKLPEKNIFKHVTKNDLYNYGFSWELLGRIQTITVMDELTADDYKKILLESESSIIRQYDNLFYQTLDTHVSITDAAACYAANEAQDTQMGARGLNQIIAGVLQPVVYEMGSNDSIRTLTIDVGDDGLFVNKIYGGRTYKEQLTDYQRNILESVPFSCVRGMGDIWEYAQSITYASQRSRNLLLNMVSSAACILAAAVALTLMDKKPSMTMDMLFHTLHTMSQDETNNNILPLADMHDKFLNKSKRYGVDFRYARKTAEDILLDYCRDYPDCMEQKQAET